MRTLNVNLSVSNSILLGVNLKGNPPVQASVAIRDTDGSIVYIPFVTVPGNKKATVEFSEVGTVLHGDVTVVEDGVPTQYSGEVMM